MIISNRNRSLSKETIRSTVKASILALGAWLLIIASPMTATAVTNATVYDATPSTLPPNVASLGFQATSTSEFGDYVHLAGTDRTLSSVTVTMSNWALFADYAADVRYNGNNVSWTHPITINIYGNELNTDGTPSNLLATTTQSVTIPWRPVADPTCAGGTAWRASDLQCYNGIAFNADFDLSSLNVTLPTDVIVGVAYNTANYGSTPIGVAGPYNSLNVGIPSGQVVSVGTDDDSDKVFWNTTYPGYTAGFKEDFNWTPNGTVAVKINASTPSVAPTSKDQCKSNGWKTFGSFKNQGDCVSSVVANSRSNR